MNLNKWNKELVMTMHKALHPRDDIDRLYVSRKEGGRGQRLEDYIGKHELGLITAIKHNTDNTIDNRITITRKQKLAKNPNTMGVLND